jgi:hypothetical protein
MQGNLSRESYQKSEGNKLKDVKSGDILLICGKNRDSQIFPDFFGLILNFYCQLSRIIFRVAVFSLAVSL